MLKQRKWSKTPGSPKAEATSQNVINNSNHDGDGDNHNDDNDDNDNENENENNP